MLQFIEKGLKNVSHTIPQCPLQFMKLSCGHYVYYILVKQNVLSINIHNYNQLTCKYFYLYGN